MPSAVVAVAAAVAVMALLRDRLLPAPPQVAGASQALPTRQPLRTDRLAASGAAARVLPRVEGSASLRQQVERLLKRGTPRDRYQAFTLLSRCAQAGDFDRHLKSLPPTVEATRMRKRYGDGAARIAEACGDLTPQLVAQRIDLVASAADDGVPGAASAWIEEGPYGDRSALTQRPDDPLVVEWAEQAIERVLAATRKSDTDAISQFGLLCLNWEMDDVARVRLLVDSALQQRRDDQLRAMLN